MSDPRHDRPLTRRSVLRGLLGAAVAASLPLAARRAKGSEGVLVEQQPTGAEIWQATSDAISDSNIRSTPPAFPTRC